MASVIHVVLPKVCLCAISTVQPRPRRPHFILFNYITAIFPAVPSYGDFSRILLLHPNPHPPRSRYYHIVVVTATTTTASSVGIAAGYGPDARGVGVRIPGGEKFFFSPRRPDRIRAPRSTLYNGYWRIFPWGKAAGV
jgi:hypothetical protein